MSRRLVVALALTVVATTTACAGPSVSPTTSSPPLGASTPVADPEPPDPPTTVTTEPTAGSTAVAAGAGASTSLGVEKPCGDLAAGDPAWWIAGYAIPGGDLLWMTATRPVTALATGTDVIAVTLDNGVTAILDSGTCHPSATLPGTRPASIGTPTLLAVAGEEGLNGISGEGGALLWTTPWPGGVADVRPGAIGISAGRIVVADAAGRILLLEPSGALVGSAGAEALAVGPGRVAAGPGIWVLATRDGAVEAYEEGSIERRWTAHVGSGAVRAVVTTGAVVAVVDDAVVALATDDGTERWRMEIPGATGAPMVGEGGVQVADEFGRLHHLLLEDGSVASVGGFGADGRAPVPIPGSGLVVAARSGTAAAHTLADETAWEVAVPEGDGPEIAAAGPGFVVLAGPVAP